MQSRPAPKIRRSVQPLPLLILLFPIWLLWLLVGREVRSSSPVQINLTREQSVVTEPLRLVADGDKVTQLNIQFLLPIDTSLSLSTEVIDANGDIIPHFDKEGWRETGTWYEDGYSGTYDESDDDLAIRLKPLNTTDVRLRFGIDSFQTLAGTPMQADVPVRYWTKNYSTNSGALWMTLGATLILCFFFLNLSYSRERICWRGKFEDPECDSSKSRMVYDQGLIKLVLKGSFGFVKGFKFRFFDAKNYRIKVVISILDSMGIAIHEVSQNALLCYRKEDGEDPWFELQVSELFFRLKSPKELRFRISLPEFVGKDNSLELDTVEVDLRDRVIVPLPVQARLIG